MVIKDKTWKSRSNWPTTVFFLHFIPPPPPNTIYWFVRTKIRVKTGSYSETLILDVFPLEQKTISLRDRCLKFSIEERQGDIRFRILKKWLWNRLSLLIIRFEAKIKTEHFQTLLNQPHWRIQPLFYIFHRIDSLIYFIRNEKRLKEWKLNLFPNTISSYLHSTFCSSLWSPNEL